MAAQAQATHPKERASESEPDNNFLNKLVNAVKTHHTEIKYIQSKVSVSAITRVRAHARDAGAVLLQAKPFSKYAAKARSPLSFGPSGSKTISASRRRHRLYTFAFLRI